MELMRQLDGARLVKFDEQAGLLLAWHGGHGVHAYNRRGVEVAFWNTGDFANNNASEEDVLESMQERIDAQDYADFS